ncbi:MAG: hypothetical protein ACTS3F_02855 [Phycisphaerales bacterium]
MIHLLNHTNTTAPADLAARSLAYRPFLDPLELHDHWFWTLIPLLLLTAMAYKGIRVGEFTARRWCAQSLIMSLQLVVLMAALAIGLHAIVEFVVPVLG